MGAGAGADAAPAVSVSGTVSRCACLPAPPQGAGTKAGGTRCPQRSQPRDALTVDFRPPSGPVRLSSSFPPRSAKTLLRPLGRRADCRRQSLASLVPTKTRDECLAREQREQPPPATARPEATTGGLGEERRRDGGTGRRGQAAPGLPARQSGPGVTACVLEATSVLRSRASAPATPLQERCPRRLRGQESRKAALV